MVIVGIIKEVKSLSMKLITNLSNRHIPVKREDMVLVEVDNKLVVSILIKNMYHDLIFVLTNI